MNEDNKTLEFRVGIFVLIGLIAIGLMAVEFGRVGQGMTDYYELKVIFPNASGLLKNSDVQLSGAVVGYVGGKPAIDEGKIGQVSVNIFVRENIRIPRGSLFQVGSSGMLGDKFVDVQIPPDYETMKLPAGETRRFYTDGETVEGTKQGGLNELAQKAEQAMVKLSDNLDALKATITTLQTGLLNEENLDNLRVTFSNIKTTGENFAKASEGFSVVMTDAKEAVSTAKETMNSAKATMDTAKVTMETANKAAEEIRGAVTDARGAISAAERLLNSARTGKGTIPTLLNNPELSNNLRALIANLRRHGLLFYKDNAQVAGEDAQPKPPRRAPQRATPRRTLH